MHYDRYDKKFKDSHGSLTWTAEEETIQKFRDEQILPNIVKGEIEGNSMSTWLEKLSLHSYEPTDEVPGEKDATENEQEAANDEDDDPNINDEDDNDDEVKSDNKHKIGE